MKEKIKILLSILQEIPLISKVQLLNLDKQLSLLKARLEELTMTVDLVAKLAIRMLVLQLEKIKFLLSFPTKIFNKKANQLSNNRL